MPQATSEVSRRATAPCSGFGIAWREGAYRIVLRKAELPPAPAPGPAR